MGALARVHGSGNPVGPDECVRSGLSLEQIERDRWARPDWSDCWPRGSRPVSRQIRVVSAQCVINALWHHGCTGQSTYGTQSLTPNVQATQRRQGDQHR